MGRIHLELSHDMVTFLCKLHLQENQSIHSGHKPASVTPKQQGQGQQGLPVHPILLGASAQQAQNPPVMVGGGCVVSQADQVVVALLLAPLQAVLEGVEAGPRPHAAAAA